MKTLVKTIVLMFVALAILMPFEQLPLVESQTSSIIDQAYAYIVNVLPIETSHYNITFSNNSTLSSYSGNPTFWVEYLMDSNDSKLTVSCIFINNSLYSALISVRTGSIIYNESYSNIVDLAKDTLQKHQEFSGFDSTEMLSLLSMVHQANPFPHILTLGNFLLETLHSSNPTNSSIYESDIFRWAYVVNDTFWVTNFDMYFVNGNFQKLDDYRSTYSAGSKNVSVTEEQAISIAVGNIDSYSYTALNGTKVSGFNVSEKQATPNLLTTVKNGNLLNPCWTILFNLSQTYPDGVNQLFVKLWADTGEVFARGNLSPTLFLNSSNPTLTPKPTSPNPSPSTTPLASPTQNPTASPSPTQTTEPTTKPSPSQSLQPSLEPTTSPTQKPTLTVEPFTATSVITLVIVVVIVTLVLVVLIIVGLMRYIVKSKKEKS